MSVQWCVRDRDLHPHNGNGIWVRTPSRLGALILREKIVASRYRGSRPWSSWRRVDHYVVPQRSQLVVQQLGGQP